ncbi:lipid-A-disaccharide synthase-related protein [Spirulina sp. CS-785/01]|uniref:lipid-A-disaccharide synthase-related protein n=1 Tax=Spirulina sp. CS-785/01 TaxID=3021716 RepID=UPI00232DB1EA|nr:lipid-A-disaccharide synthase-related protein [Spirulina sp. CS-785/01]MDB9314432.1 lipid-A-disaccharide synthase-related protein [Spirulina sp. CS-785/01]
MKLLCLSNGHGEDIIAVRILEELRKADESLEIAALPLVGEGLAYAKAEIPIAGPVKSMPSGGFIYMDGRQLWQDVKGGLMRLTIAQYRVVRRWRKEGGKILAVGDIVPLLFAWLSGTDYAFVGTAKSEYYIRDEFGKLLKSRKGEAWSGSVYLPWERWLMRRRRCRAVFPRDRMTTQVLKRFSIPAYDLGNPMMDGIIPENPNPQYEERMSQIREKDQPLNILLLPGSRPPEGYNNWSLILEAVTVVCNHFHKRSLRFLAAIAPSLDTQPLEDALLSNRWDSEAEYPLDIPFLDPDARVFRRDKALLIVTQQNYNACLLAGDFAIAMAGTATEQFVGLGKPAIALPGKGPQFTPKFAEAQTRLLGVSVLLVKRPEDVPQMMQRVLENPDLLQIIAENGVKRMGQRGAAGRIAACLQEKLVDG